MSEERWMPSEDEFMEGSGLGLANGSRTWPRIKALIRRAAQERAIEELEGLRLSPNAYSAATGAWCVTVAVINKRIAALRSDGDALSAGRGGGRKESE